MQLTFTTRTRGRWFSLALALLLSGLTYRAAAQLTPAAFPANCAAPPAYNYVIGSPGVVTNYSGSYTFPVGTYHVTGPCILKAAPSPSSPAPASTSTASSARPAASRRWTATP